METLEAKKTVLIVDDAQLMRLVISNLVKSDSRYLVMYSANGQEALEAIKKKDPDIILLDIEMPKMDGLSFLRHARLKTRAKIVVLSSVAGAGSEQTKEARRLGADAIFQKPSGSVSMDLAEKLGPALLSTLKRLSP